MVSGAMRERNSNRNKVRLEILVTHSKQTIGLDSNRYFFRGSEERGAPRNEAAFIAVSRMRQTPNLRRCPHQSLNRCVKLLRDRERQPIE